MPRDDWKRKGIRGAYERQQELEVREERDLQALAGKMLRQQAEEKAVRQERARVKAEAGAAKRRRKREVEQPEQAMANQSPIEADPERQGEVMAEANKLYADGGVIGRNPSAHGGTWAWCLVSGLDRVREASGTVTPAEIGLPLVTNNLTELLAAVTGLEAMPDGWGGTLYTDSKITLLRVSKTKRQAKLNGIPDALRARLQAVKDRLGGYKVVLLGGHPSRGELLDGRRKDGMPVSIHNVHCDSLCGREARLFLASQRVSGGVS